MITARLVGMERVEKGLRDMRRAWTREELRTALVESAEPVAAGIRGLAPRRDRGRIAASVTIAEIEPQQGESVRIGIGAAGGKGGWGWLSGLFEFGTSKMAARPHLRPAWETHGPRALESIRDWVGDKLRAAALAAGFKVDR